MVVYYTEKYPKAKNQLLTWYTEILKQDFANFRRQACYTIWFGTHKEYDKIDVLEVIKEKMKEQGLKSKDLEPLIGTKGHVSTILSGRREITLKMAQRLKDYFQLPAEIFLHTA